jgi:hypothetical protein
MDHGTGVPKGQRSPSGMKGLQSISRMQSKVARHSACEWYFGSGIVQQKPEIIDDGKKITRLIERVGQKYVDPRERTMTNSSGSFPG